MSTKQNVRGRLPPEMSVLRRRTRMQIDWIDIDGVRLRYGLRGGQGRPMLLLNTLGADLDMMLPLVNALDGYELIVPEPPGAGASPACVVPHGMRWHARLMSRLLDRLGYDMPINIVGLGWGGSLAQAIALAFPARTNRLVLAASAVAGFGTAVNTLSWKRFQAARERGRDAGQSADLSSVYGGLIRQRPELTGRHGARAGVPSTRGYLNQLVAGAGFTRAHRLHHLMCPTLVMGGDDDPIAPLVHSRLLYWLIPKSTLHVMRGGGHLFLLLRANESAAVILRFLNERRYDGTDHADYFRVHGLPADGRIRPPARPDSANA